MTLWMCRESGIYTRRKIQADVTLTQDERRQEKMLAIYILNDEGEATGEVRHFCDADCRIRYTDSNCLKGVAYSYGESQDYVQGTQCDECGKIQADSL